MRLMSFSRSLSIQRRGWKLLFVLMLNSVRTSISSSLDVINECIAEIVLSESEDYKRHYNLLTSNQQQLLRAIGIEKCVQSINSGEFLLRYGFKSTSSINKALSYLLDKEYVYRSDNGYIVYDRFMGLWLLNQA